MSPAMDFEPRVHWDVSVQSYLEAALEAQRFQDIQKALIRPPLSTCLRVNSLRVSTEAVVKQVNARVSRQQRGSHNLAAVHPLVPDAVMLPGQPSDGCIDYAAAGGKEVRITRKTGEAVLRGAPIYAPGMLACSAHINAGDLVAVSIAIEPPGSEWCGITRGSLLTEALNAPSLRTLYIGVGRAQMSRADMFRQSSGTAVVMEQSVFPMPVPVQGLQGVMIQNLPSIVAAMALQPKPGSRVLDMCAAPGGKATMLAQLMRDQGVVVALDRSQAKASQVTSLANELGLTIIQAFRMDATRAVLLEKRSRGKQQEQQQGGGQLTPEEWEQQQQRLAVSAAAGAEKVQKRAARKHAARVLRGFEQSGPKASAAQPPIQDHHNHQQQQQQQQQEPSRLEGHESGSAHAAAAVQHQHEVAPPALQASPEGFPPESFDAVLLDAPCSALGLRPRLVQSATPLYLAQCGLYARKLLDAAVHLIRPGGRLLFSTCTISPFENEASVRYILDKFSHCIRLVPAEPRVGGAGLVGRHPSGGIQACLNNSSTEREQRGASVQGQEGVQCQNSHDAPCMRAVGDGEKAQCSEAWLSEEEASLVQRFDPSGPQDTIGFFVAAFEKTQSVCQTQQ
ncbi:hypothetical protein DUNSADRAFT_9857 [Dunaliella salina]|uniref:SAM-dependent MTase RsmB/NOP-type domain-containing protein n=1 Tax=Dunaliella salina TaxID=3046 RepID=A0ABQ7H547_DUNSA|nr:hypothetical protein DUNSADRAFT_9857 [Dunaliella salina]|eukprot:KAF5841976.1 hypothetical protein DUNSADRAFT_9857 [Dunaliella salina]